METVMAAVAMAAKATNDIIVARDFATKVEIVNFLGSHGVPLALSTDVQAFGMIQDGNYIAAVVFNNFYGRVCSMHMAGNGHWVTREALRAVFGYPFVQLELVAVEGRVAADNSYSIELTKRFGFEEVRRINEGWAPGVDLICFEMRREACRYLNRRI
jgi:RimJ/RimL family protein N-acetyltransferase